MQANWIGYKFDENDLNRFNRSLIVKKLRELFKQEFPNKQHWKFQIAKDAYSGIRIRIVRAPIAAFDFQKVTAKKYQGRSISFYDFRTEITNKLEKEANAFNYDNSDSMSDYFDRNYYVHWEMGTWTKPEGERIEIVAK